MHGSASGCCSACGFDADRHAMLLQSFASEGSTSYAKHSLLSGEIDWLLSPSSPVGGTLIPQHVNRSSDVLS